MRPAATMDRVRHTRFPFLSLCVAATATLCAVLPAKSEWTGEEVQENGNLVVRNPEEPAGGTRDITLEELWRIGGEDDEDILLGVVNRLVKDEEENIYLLDSQLNEVMVFSPDGEFLRTMGRQGEGPGEFSNAFDLFIGPAGLVNVVQVFPGRIVQLTKDGEPAGTFRLPETEGGAFQLVYRCQGNADHLVISGALQEGAGPERVQRVYLKSFDSDGNEVAHFTDQANPMRYGGMTFEEKTFSNFSSRWGLAADGRVAAALDFDAYRIHVWNADGSVDRIIERPGYQALEREAADRDRFQRLYDGITSWNPGSTFEISDTHVAINQMVYREDGTLWVLAGSGIWGRSEGVLAVFDVYDEAGRYIQRVRLLGDGDPQDDGVFFVGNRIYVVTELFSAALGSMAAGGDEEESDDYEPVSVIAYDMLGIEGTVSTK